jgi:hypothetical protein
MVKMPAMGAHSAQSPERAIDAILSTFDGRPLLTSELTDRLRTRLPGLTCDAYGEAIATLLHDGRLCISDGRYVRTDLPSARPNAFHAEGSRRWLARRK